MQLPDNPIMLLSVINQKLRDFYPSLDKLCDDMNIDKAELCEKLRAAGFDYNENTNMFF